MRCISTATHAVELSASRSFPGHGLYTQCASNLRAGQSRTTASPKNSAVGWSTLVKFTFRSLPRNTVAYALIALVPLAAYSQEASAPETHGIVVANMDRSVNPGDDLYHYANGDWTRRTQISPDSGRSLNYILLDETARPTPVFPSSSSRLSCRQTRLKLLLKCSICRSRFLRKL